MRIVAKGGHVKESPFNYMEIYYNHILRHSAVGSVALDVTLYKVFK